MRQRKRFDYLPFRVGGREPQIKRQPFLSDGRVERANRKRITMAYAIFAGIVVIFLGTKFIHRKSNSPTTQEIAAVKVAAATPTPIPTATETNFLRQVTQCFLPISKLYGYDLYISAGFRSFDEQDQLYEQGRSVAGHIVTNAKGGDSIHNFGLAIDLADHRYGIDLDWDKLEKIGTYCGLEHGDRGYTDLPHFQYIGHLSIEDLKAGKAPEPLTLPCPAMSEATPLTMSELNACNAPSFSNSNSSVHIVAPPLNQYYINN